MDKMTIELTQNEVNALIQLIHIATQARGLEVAEVATYFQKKLGSIKPNAETDNREHSEPQPVSD